MKVNKSSINKIKRDSFSNLVKKNRRSFLKMKGNPNIGFSCRVTIPIENAQRMIEHSLSNGYSNMSFFISFDRSKIQSDLNSYEYVGYIMPIEENRHYFSEEEFNTISQDVQKKAKIEEFYSEKFGKKKKVSFVEDNTEFDFQFILKKEKYAINI